MERVSRGVPPRRMFQWRRGEKACREVPFLRNAGNPKGPRASLSPRPPSRERKPSRVAVRARSRPSYLLCVLRPLVHAPGLLLPRFLLMVEPLSVPLLEELYVLVLRHLASIVSSPLRTLATPPEDLLLSPLSRRPGPPPCSSLATTQFFLTSPLSKNLNRI